MRLAPLLLAAGCVVPLAPTDRLSAPYAQPFAPPAVFRDWWRGMEACTGRRRDFGSVAWYVSPAGTLVLDGVRRSGVWEPPRRIHLTDVIVAHLDRYRSTVAHEMGHALGLSHGDLLDRCERVVAGP